MERTRQEKEAAESRKNDQAPEQLQNRLPSHKLGDLIKHPSKEKVKESYEKWKRDLKKKSNEKVPSLF